ncbi:hypothetical protein Pan258_56260 [Symmachiella dynata]|nr:hypothetical protein Pan258_56260 [Symmachiella dynata]
MPLWKPISESCTEPKIGFESPPALLAVSGVLIPAMVDWFPESVTLIKRVSYHKYFVSSTVLLTSQPVLAARILSFETPLRAFLAGNLDS